ncbi:hypothetical protein CDIK_1106 [Cucumispora dikerogammari]|nr:hypothetical protein CDIK_1106 [Cucumispora dikerogammari]
MRHNVENNTNNQNLSLEQNNKQIPARVMEIFNNSNLIKAITPVLDEEHLTIFRMEIFSEIVLLAKKENLNNNGAIANVELNPRLNQLVQNMHDFLEDCMIDIDFSILHEFICKLIALYEKESRFEALM